MKLPLAEDRDELMAAADAALTPKTRLLALSHVTTDFGFRFPSEPLCALARERGIPSFLDLAHSCGAVPYRLRDLGCDFAGLLSYKWMFSPYAAGAPVGAPRKAPRHRGHLRRLPAPRSGSTSRATPSSCPTRPSASSTAPGRGRWSTPGPRRPTGSRRSDRRRSGPACAS